MKIKKIEDYQIEELENGNLFINKYDLSLKYLYELNPCWKEFFFDLLNELVSKKSFYIRQDSKESLLDYMKRVYPNLIERYDLKIDFRDYIELNDYVSYSEWIKEEHNFIAFKDMDLYLISNKTDLFE